MSSEPMEQWLHNGGFAQIGPHRLKPREHPDMSGTPLSIQRGQAEAFVLDDDNGGRWIIKKFHTGCGLDADYLRAVTQSLPPHDGLTAGTRRLILTRADLSMGNGDFHSRALAQWLDSAILMPRIAGVDWASVADKLRDGDIELSLDERVALVRTASELIKLLEQHDLSHRDLSSGNVFVDTNRWMILLIDFDSVYGPQLAMPTATTCGTAGYTAPFTWQDGKLNATATWRPNADRYALAILICEILTLTKGAPLTDEGGMFNQDELRRRSGPGIDRIMAALETVDPQAAVLLRRALQSQDFDDCPAPRDWLAFCDSVSVGHISPPRFAELESVEADFFARILAKRRPAAPLWPVPQLRDLPTVSIEVPRKPIVAPAHAVMLPADPWRASR